MSKHAYLIIAYNQWNLLKKLIHMLDDERNDIYVHVNRLINNVPFDNFINNNGIDLNKFPIHETIHLNNNNAQNGNN